MTLSESRLRDDAARLAQALEAGGLGSWEYEVEGRRLHGSPTFEAMLGFAPGTFPGTFEAWSERVHPEDREAVVKQLDAALAGGSAIRALHRIVRPDGEVRWIEGEGLVDRDGDGAAVRVVGIARDVTEQHRAELAARASEARFRLMANRAPVLIWIADTRGEATWFNRPWLAFTGRTLEQELGSGWAEGVHRDDRDRCLGIYRAAFERRTPFVMEYRLRRHDGAWRWILVHGIPMDSPDGTFTGYIGSGVDIHGRIEAEQEREGLLAQVQLERSRLALANERLSSQAEELESQAAELRRQSDELLEVQAGLRESEERYRSFIEQSSEAMWRFELDRPVDTRLPVREQVEQVLANAWLAECNDRFAQMYGFEHASEMIGFRLGELLDRSDPRNLEYLEAFVRAGYRLTEAESQELDREGRHKVFLNNLVGIVAEGRLVRAWGTQRDVTERRRADESFAFLAEASRVLAESLDPDATLQTIVRAVVPRLADTCAIESVQPDGSSETLARAHAVPELERQLRQWTVRSGPGTSPRKLVHDVVESRRPILLEQVEPGLVERISSTPEHAAFLREHPLRSKVMLPLVARGTVIGVLSLAHDVSERRFSAEDLPLLEEFARRAAVALDNARLHHDLDARVRSATRSLEDTIEELRNYTHSISHDLRAPLRAMRGYAEALEDETGERLGEDGREYVRRIGDAAERMDLLIQDLLAYSRLSQHEMQLTSGPVALAATVEEALVALEAEARERGATIAVADLASLPAVAAHRPTLFQVAVNLLSNAIKFTRPGQKAEVRVWGEAREGRVRLWVEDRGIGIEPEHLERIFRVFERLHGGDTYPGTGVGLAIVKKAVERMDGEVGIESTPGEGSRFWVELPVWHGPAPAGSEAE